MRTAKRRGRQGCALLKDDIADTGAAGLPDSQVGKRETKDVDFNAIDGAHAGSLALPIQVRGPTVVVCTANLF